MIRGRSGRARPLGLRAIRAEGAATQQHLVVADTRDPATSEPRRGGEQDLDAADALVDDAATKRMAPVLWLSIAIMVVTPFFASTEAGRTATTILVGGIAVIALHRSGARPTVLRAGEALVALIALASVLSRELGEVDDALTVIGLALLCLLLLVTPAVVVVRLAHRPAVTLDTVAGALAAYVQIGLFFTVVYRLVGIVQSAPFFAEPGGSSLMDYEFFSFVTLTTLGYGNLVPATDAGKSLAMLEALLGQVFLVTVVAMAVSHLGSTRRPDRT